MLTPDKLPFKPLIIGVSVIILIYMVSEFLDERYFNESVKNGLGEVETIKLNSKVVHFKAYMKRFNKSYNGEEFWKRFKNFQESLSEISDYNQGSGAKFGLTKFSDMSKEELFPALISSRLKVCPSKDQPCTTSGVQDKKYVSAFNDNKVIPNNFDWRDRNGVVGPVLNQGRCNGCWAFGIVGLVESMSAIRLNETNVRRSIQEVLDCALESINSCEEGNVVNALTNLCNNRLGIVKEHQYPLTLVDEECRVTDPEGRRIKHFWSQCEVNENSDDLLRLISTHGPVMAIVYAEPWKNYINGIIERSCVRSKDGQTHDHVVQIVGYDRRPEVETPYYIIRNSWGEDFGEDGYLRLAIGSNVCGVADQILHLDVY